MILLNKIKGHKHHIQEHKELNHFKLYSFRNKIAEINKICYH
jgi:hypothetical protein